MGREEKSLLFTKIMLLKDHITCLKMELYFKMQCKTCEFIKKGMTENQTDLAFIEELITYT